MISPYYKLFAFCMLAGCSQSNSGNDKFTDETKIVVNQKSQATYDQVLKVLNKNDLDSLVNHYLGKTLQGSIGLSPGDIGLSIGLFYNGKDYFYNYGVTKLGTTRRPDQNSLYEIGSITKIFTSLLLAKAAIDGKVR